MLRSVFLKTLRDQRRSLLWWSIGLVILAASIMAFYPSFADAPEFDTLLEEMPEWLAKSFAGDVSDFTSPEGYLNSQMFVLSLPLMFMIFAIAQGSGTIAGEEDRGTLDLLLSNPLARWRVVAEKFGAMSIATLILAFACWLALAIGAAAVGMEISIWLMAQVTLSGALLGLTFGALALALGCLTGKRGVCIGVASTLGVVAYFLNALAPLVEVLEPSRKLSPFYYYIGADPLTNGLNLGHVSVLIVLPVVLLGMAIITFNRRDLVV